ncbi:multicopper oxidase domain-containing protein [Kitasatospora sp. NPDC053057]|uniref:multicopper oxidase domain-containing protein n=1 Tax=Kitasatospora sp. NPDC053057 TaxID=3364062 RepID=UPI0037C67C75
MVNHLPVATNLHFHGLHVSPEGQSDDPFLCVAPGQSTTYKLAIPADHPQGTFWYHSHAMGTTCPAPGSQSMPDMAAMPGDVENQIFAGLSARSSSATTAPCSRRTCATSPRTPSSSRTSSSTPPGTSCRTPTPPRSTPATRPCAWSTANCGRCCR